MASPRKLGLLEVYNVDVAWPAARSLEVHQTGCCGWGVSVVAALEDTYKADYIKPRTPWLDTASNMQLYSRNFLSLNGPHISLPVSLDSPGQHNASHVSDLEHLRPCRLVRPRQSYTLSPIGGDY